MMNVCLGNLRFAAACLTSAAVAAAIILAGPAVLTAAEGNDARAATKRTPAVRVPWNTSRISGSPEPPAAYDIQRVFENLTFQLPVALMSAPGSDRLFLVELEGKIFSFVNDPQVQQADLMIDLHQQIEGHRRTYGLAFHPHFEENGYVYICYVTEDGDPQGTRLSRFRVNGADPPQCDPASEKILIQWVAGGHNGGCLKFGPEGYLYISTGDATSPSPPDGLQTGQDLSDLLSSILRIDVDRSDAPLPYAVPKDNPFVDLPGARPEIWAYGFRNPWRMNFDRQTGQLWVGDVGWEMWEMIYLVQRGGNYGWSVVEGPQEVLREATRGPTPILPPVAAHSHIESRSITGGLVYRGGRLPQLTGAYIYGDYVTGKLWGLRWDGSRLTWQEELLDAPLQIIAFGEDHSSEMYIVGYDGTIHRLVKNTAGRQNLDFPKKLSQTGLFSSVADHAMAPGVIAYRINAEPWADGATAQRYIAIPNTATIGVYTKEENNPQRGTLTGQWKYPSDTVFVKTLSLETETGNPDSRRRLETQIMHRDGDTWRAYTYVWNDQQNDASLAPAEGLDLALTISDPAASAERRRQTWHVAGRTECLVCHSTRGGSIYGFYTAQLNRDHDDRAGSVNQLRALAQAGLFEKPLGDDPPRIPSPHDETVDVNQRARAYLHVNCAHCHRRGGGGTALFELLYDLSLEKTLLVGGRPTQGAFGMHAAEVVAAGDPYRSVMWYRMSKLGRGRMPYAGSSLVDRRGIRLIHDWIAQLPSRVDDSDRPSPSAKLRRDQLLEVKAIRAGGAPADAAIDRLLSTTSGALLLLKAVDDRSLPATTARQAIAKATAHEAPERRELFEQFLPESQRTKRLGSVIRPGEILSLSGDAVRGQKLFAATQGVQCQSCHRIGQVGTVLGPDLSQIGKKYKRAALLETIMQPSKNIEPKYIAYLVETTRGRVHSGLLVERTDQAVTLRDTQNKLVRVPLEEIDLLVPQQKSIMPELLLREMTAQQVADLLAYLGSLQ